MIPTADLDDAAKALRIVGVTALCHQERRIVELEIETLRVAALRVATGLVALRSGVAVIDRDQEAPFIVWVDRDAHAGCGERIGRAANRHIGRRDRGPTPSAVDEE